MQEQPTVSMPFQGSPSPPVDVAPVPVAQATDPNAISWTASEFIAHSKSGSWYMILGLIAVVLAVLSYFFADTMTSIIVVIVALLFGFIGARKPRELQYQVDDQGILIDKKLYTYDHFKSFSIMQEEGIESIWLMPLQRFAPGLSIYFSPQEGQKIVNLLGTFLPFEERKLDAIDKLMHRIRF